MCGLIFTCTFLAEFPQFDAIFKLLQRRGPNNCSIIVRTLPTSVNLSDSGNAGQDLRLTFASTVLSLRGNEVISQPIVHNESGSLLCWNGEAWSLSGNIILGNDAQALFETLSNRFESLRLDSSTKAKHYSIQSATIIREVFGSIEGPFAFLYYDTFSQRIFYGRDALGRRSLLVHRMNNKFAISSVTEKVAGDEWTEVPATGIFELDLHCLRTSLNLSLKGSLQHDQKTANTIIADEILHPWADIKCMPQLNREQVRDEDNVSINTETIYELYDALHSSLTIRLQNLPSPNDKDGSRVAILFSGGLDCTLIARICDDIMPRSEDIDLLNVAFENPRVIAAAKTRVEPANAELSDPFSRCPDRITGIASHKELQAACPGRNWRFVAIDVPYAEMLSQKPQVSILMYPHVTEMDMSISLALYFAARGKGTLICPNSGLEYQSNACILLSGLGADELFAGYSRHEIAFAKNGQTGLLNELQVDYERISTRNLGRDDRIISHWGKEVRYPYLDERVVHWVLERPAWEKLGFVYKQRNRSATGGKPLQNVNKLLLRLLCMDLGIEVAADEKKRAIQFGARTARMHSGKVKGTQIVLEATSLY